MLTRRGKRALWHTRFTAPNGDRISRSTGTADKRLAKEFEAKLQRELWRVQKLGEPERRTWQEAVERWCRWRAGKRSLSRDLREFRWLHPILGDLALDQITGDVIDEIVATRQRAGSSPATCNRTLALVRSVLRAAEEEWGWTVKAPRIRLLDEPKKAPRYLTPDEAARLLRELPPHLAMMMRFALATGLRDQNVTRLQWSQVDLGRGLVSVNAESAKGKRSLAVPLNDDAREVLRACAGQHPEFVFVYRASDAAEPQPVLRPNNSAFRKAVARAGLTGVNWHTLRHTWASWHTQGGTPAQVLQELGGWSSLAMVLRYSHLQQSHLAEHAGRVQSNLRLVVDNTGANSVHTPDAPAANAVTR